MTPWRFRSKPKSEPSQAVRGLVDTDRPMAAPARRLAQRPPAAHFHATDGFLTRRRTGSHGHQQSLVNGGSRAPDLRTGKVAARPKPKATPVNKAEAAAFPFGAVPRIHGQPTLAPRSGRQLELGYWVASPPWRRISARGMVAHETRQRMPIQPSTRPKKRRLRSQACCAHTGSYWVIGMRPGPTAVSLAKPCWAK